VSTKLRTDTSANSARTASAQARVSSAGLSPLEHPCRAAAHAPHRPRVPLLRHVAPWADRVRGRRTSAARARHMRQVVDPGPRRSGSACASRFSESVHARWLVLVNDQGRKSESTPQTRCKNGSGGDIPQSRSSVQADVKLAQADDRPGRPAPLPRHHAPSGSRSSSPRSSRLADRGNPFSLPGTGSG
jgi:hypothetical protein